MVDRHAIVQGVKVPTFIYGTAWKETDTERLTQTAVDTGFVGIDTANQRRHYVEAGVGAALKAVLETGEIKRPEIFVQTKFTYVDGQDHRLPYERSAPVSDQVEQSFASSIEHLGVDYIDSYVLHGPSRRHGLGQVDWEAWAALERLHGNGKTRLLGISNVAIDQLEELYAKASVKPAVVQNRCFASTGWDRVIRSFCTEHGILYQGFSLLTANRELLGLRRVQEIASRVGRTIPQVIFRFALELGMVALTGTTSPEHMQQDLAVYDFEIDSAEVADVESLATRTP